MKQCAIIHADFLNEEINDKFDVIIGNQEL